MSIESKYLEILQKKQTSVKFPKSLVNEVMENFLTENGKMSELDAKLFITNHPELLNFKEGTITSKFNEYAKLGWKNVDITNAMEKYKSFKLICYNTQDLKDKVMVLKDLGYKSKQIISNPQILGCPSKDIKIKFMFAKLFNLDTKQVKYFIQSIEKTYYRTCYLAETKPEVFDFNSKTLTKEITNSTSRFTKKYGIENDELKYAYRLSLETINKIEQHYHKLAEENDLPMIELTDEEKRESLNRSDLNIIRNYIKNHKNSKEK